MARRHYEGSDLLSKLRRCQELIMARSGADDLNEITKLLVAKHLGERHASRLRLDSVSANAILHEHRALVERFIEGPASLMVPPEVGNECLRILGTTRLLNESFEVIDAAFEVLTSQHYKSDKGQYFTPRHVIDMCVRALRPQPGELICDPACGSGAFLKAAWDSMSPRGRSKAMLYGFDISPRAVKAASLMSYLGTNNAFSVTQLDALNLSGRGLFDGSGITIEDVMVEQRKGGFAGFDLVLTNPPFAGDVSGHEFIRDYEVRNFIEGRMERDVLFIERCIALLREGGRLAIVLPDNKVSSQKFAPLRQWILRKVHVEAVVSLHAYTFRPHTSQKAAVIFATKTAESRPYPVRFYRSDNPGKSSNGEPAYRAGTLTRSMHELDTDLPAIADDLARELAA